LNINTLFKTTLLFSACFGVFVLILVYWFLVGGISPRGLGVGLACLFVAGTIALALFSKSRSKRVSIMEPQDVGSGSRRGKASAIWVGKIAVVVLILAFLNGLWHIREKPLAPRLVGLGANLLVTLAVAGAVRKMQGGPKK
jgi:hypothetical protein